MSLSRLEYEKEVLGSLANLVKIYADPKLFIFFRLENFSKIIETCEATQYLNDNYAKNRYCYSNPSMVIEWWNIQFGTDYTEEQVKKLIILL